jgi:hypothetical protein
LVPGKSHENDHEHQKTTAGCHTRNTFHHTVTSASATAQAGHTAYFEAQSPTEDFAETQRDHSHNYRAILARFLKNPAFALEKRPPEAASVLVSYHFTDSLMNSQRWEVLRHGKENRKDAFDFPMCQS